MICEANSLLVESRIIAKRVFRRLLAYVHVEIDDTSGAAPVSIRVHGGTIK
jgi:hypothetical protein